MVGIVRTLDSRGRYGVVATGEGPNFIFLPSSCRTAVDRGDEVEFWLDDNPDGKGLCAVDVAARRDGKVLPEAPSARLFVGNIEYAVEQDELAIALEAAGPLLSIFKRPGGAVAFVEFQNVEDARRLLNGEIDVDVRGRQLRFKPQR